MLPLIGLNARRGRDSQGEGRSRAGGETEVSGGCLWLSAVSVRGMFALVGVIGILRF